MQIFGGFGRGKDEPQALRLYVAATKRTPNVEPQCLRLKPILINSNYISRGLWFQYRLLFITSAGVYGFNIVIVHYISRGLCFQYRHCSLHQQGFMFSISSLFITSAEVYVFNIVFCSLYQQGFMFLTKQHPCLISITPPGLQHESLF